ncbi:MAG: thioredoxin [Anaerolineales bacterium]|nr:thioredoxin [Anaerolineales bacterium]
MSDLKMISDQEFDQEVLQADSPVLVDFTAAWCGPCKMLAPILEELAADWDQKISIRKLDVDQNQETAMKYGVMGVPTLILFKDGEIAARMTGYKPKKHLINLFQTHL